MDRSRARSPDDPAARRSARPTAARARGADVSARQQSNSRADRAPDFRRVPRTGPARHPGDHLGNTDVVGDIHRLIVFDLDGTLVDSRRDLADSANELIVERGGAPLAEDAIGKMVG